MSIAEILRESLKPLVPVVQLVQSKENIGNKATSYMEHIWTSEKNGLVPVVHDVVQLPLSDTQNSAGSSGTNEPSSSGPGLEDRQKLALKPQSENTAQLNQRDQSKMLSPEDLGEPVILHPADGTPLAFKNAESHIKVFAWALLNLRFAPWEQLAIGKLAMECGLSIGEARKGLNILIQDGDLKVERNRSREYYWLAPLSYPEPKEIFQ